MALTSSIERLASRIGVGAGGRNIGRTTMVRLTLYYFVVIMIIAGFIILTGNAKAMMESSGGGQIPVGGQVLQDGLAGGDQAQQLVESFWDPLFKSLPPLAYGAAAVIGSFLLALPVAFTYVRTRNSLKYDQSLVQTVIMLPVVVTAILIVVENSLALAFSLAGIVAAIRFRSNLKDNRDAVYILAAVGIGFASGVGTLTIATFLSLFFCVLELLLWKLDLTADHERTFGMLCMPASAVRAGGGIDIASLPGDASHMMPSANTQLLAMGGASPTVEVEGNGARQKKADERLLIYVTDPDKGRELARTILDETTKQWKLRKTRDGGNDQFVLEYRIRLKKKQSAAAVIERLYAEGTPIVLAAETVAPDE
jgi:uncharacterized membrane protein YhiD involved in acid resistance